MTGQIGAEQIGFVGLGNMGAPMVRCLVKAGHRVAVFDTRVERASVLASEHMSIATATSLRDLGRQSSVLVTMLPDSSVVRAVVLGDNGLATGMARGSVIVDMSSSYAPDTIALGADLSARGIGLVDAPVSGGVGKAVTGALAIMAGGDPASIERVAPILSAMGIVHRAGMLGAGHALKALNNYVSAAGLIATCEALVAAKAFGLDPTVAIKIINVSTGRNNTTEAKADRYLIPETFDSGFALALMSKDVGMAHTLARALGLAAEEMAFVDAYLKRAADMLGPAADHTAVMMFAQQRASGRT
jgi:3-hydroxyisobutyrate dehydrogenase